jgi:hypothetical protein
MTIYGKKLIDPEVGEHEDRVFVVMEYVDGDRR